MERKLPILAEEIDLVFGNIEQLEQFHRYVHFVIICVSICALDVRVNSFIISMSLNLKSTKNPEQIEHHLIHSIAECVRPSLSLQVQVQNTRSNKWSTSEREGPSPISL